MVRILILGLPPRFPLPANYCADVAARGARWANWSDDGEADAPLAPDARAAALVAQLTSEEKYRLVQGVGWRGWVRGDGIFHGNTLAIPRLGIPALQMQDAGQGWATTDSRMVGQVTSWPCALAAAASWDAPLVHRWAAAIGREFHAKGANVLLGPGGAPVAACRRTLPCSQPQPL
eukprot:3496491-Prymnesium_polylepis.1